MVDKEIVLITGSSGFIGEKLAESLSAKYEVIGLDRDAPLRQISGVNYFNVNITSSEDVSQVLQEIRERHGSRLLSVIHLVAYYSFSGEEDHRYDTITIEGTRSLMIHLRENFNVEQFIFSSSMLVYAAVKPGNFISDDSPLNPTWPYPKSKVKAEEVLRQENGDVPVVNLRIAGVYDDFCHSPTISNQIVRIYERWATSVPFPGNADHGQTFLHLHDLAEAIQLLIEKRANLGNFENFVLGEEEVLSYRELQETIGQQLHRQPWPTIRIPAIVAKVGAMVMQHLPFIREPFIKPWMIEHSDEHFAVDMTRLKKILHWHPKRKLRDRIPKMIENLKNEPHKWYAINKIPLPTFRSLNMIGEDQEKNLYFAAVINIFLGIWLIANPFTFGALESTEFWSEIITGLFVTIFATLSLIPTIRWFRWVNANLGMWLLFSPLVFHSQEAAAYSNDTLIGGIIMIASVYTPSPVEAAHDAGIPPGWSYNPSTAGQRLPIMFLAFLGFLFSRYLAAFQLGHIPTIWEPFFADGTVKVLRSEVSQAFPISDAGLGALTYLLDMVAASIGGRERWRTLPWAVILFGFMIIPAGVTSIVLIMLQPISVGAWCTVCLITAFIMLLMVPPAIDEVLASVQFLRRQKAQGVSFWRVFWLGQATPEKSSLTPEFKPKGSVIHLLFCSALGMWLMFGPAVFNVDGVASDNIYIVAALITTFAVISCSEVGRIARLVNVPLGVWLATSVWMFNPMSDFAIWHFTISGIVVMLLSLPAGKVTQSYGTANRLTHWTPLRK